jgi:hypothetical protein
MHLTAVRTQTERKRQDRSVRRAEKLRCRAGMTRVRGLIRPTPGVWATADTARSERRLINWQDQAILLADGSPLGECRIHEKQFIIDLNHGIRLASDANLPVARTALANGESRCGP